MRAFQALAVPPAQIRRRVICALKKFHQRSFRRGRSSHIIVHKQKLFHLWMVKGRFGTNALLRKTRRFRCGIGIERGPLNLSSTRPKSSAADFVGVRFPCNGVSARPLRRRPAGESSNRKIETSPEKMYRTILSLKSAAEFLEHLVDPDQDAPEFVDRFRISTITPSSVSAAMNRL